MEKIKGYKLHLVVVVVLLGLVVFATFYFRMGSDGGGGFSLDRLWSAWKRYQDPKMIELDRVLRNASMGDDRIVILTTLNDAWAEPNSIFDVFREGFDIGEETRPLWKHLTVVAIDEKAMNRCKSIHPHCYLLTIDGVASPGSEKRYMTKEYVKWMWERTNFLGNVLELGYSFVLTDVDIVWFRSPFPHFSPNDDFTIACDLFNGNPYDISNHINGGFIFVRSNRRTIKLYKHWYDVRTQYPGKNEQDVFNIIKVSKFVKNLKMKMRFLDTSIFGGFCHHGDDLNKLCTLHANCCVGLERKIKDLRMVLDVWKNFTGLSENKKEGFSWRAPVECRMRR